MNLRDLTAYWKSLLRLDGCPKFCGDAGGDGQAVVSSHGTSYHRRFVDTPRTRMLEKGAREALLIRLERHGRRVVIAEVL